MLHFGSDRPEFPLGTVYGLAPVLGYQRRITPALELTGVLLPALNSDLRQVRATDLRWGYVMRGVYRTSPRLAWRATVGYRQQFYGPQYVLLLGLDWHPAPAWRVFGDLPTTLTASYAVSPRANVGFNLTGINTAYRLDQDERYVQYQQAHYGVFAEHYLGPRWVVRATAAYALTRRIAVFEKDSQWAGTIDYIGLGTPPVPVSEPYAKGTALRLTLSYRVSQP